MGARRLAAAVARAARAAVLGLLLGSTSFTHAQVVEGPASQPRADGFEHSAEAAAIVGAQLDEARGAASLGDWESAAVWLDEAATGDQGNSDVLYLRALASVKRARPLQEALGDLNAALAAGRFAVYTKADAFTLKAELLVRERRWAEALDALGRVGPPAGGEPAARLIRARALAGKGDLHGLMAELDSALRRFPDSSGFARLFITRAGSLLPSGLTRELGELILGRLTRYSLSDPELPVLAAPLMGDMEEQRRAVLAFRAGGGSSPAATLRALEYGLIDEAAASSEFFSKSYAFTLADLASLQALAGSPAGREAVLSALKSWTGSFSVDADGDGVAEAHVSLSKGLVSSFEGDSRQEGRVDLRVSFADGLPSEAVLDVGGTILSCLYSSYPRLSSLSFAEAGERRSYSFAPEALSFAPLAMRAFAGTGRESVYLPYATKSLPPSERTAALSALSLAREKGSSREVTVLERGIPQSAEDYEGGRLLSTTSYSRGRPLLQRIDVDGDGRFESERRYAPDGSWTQRTDADGDGVFEYSESSAFPFEKEWDYDGNGSVDARQYQRADGALVQEYSSRLDGRLDELVVFKGGKLVSIARDGAKLALIPDSNPVLTWIGEKRFDLGSNLPAGEGIFKAMAYRYRLNWLGDFAFAELIP